MRAAGRGIHEWNTAASSQHRQEITTRSRLHSTRRDKRSEDVSAFPLLVLFVTGQILWITISACSCFILHAESSSYVRWSEYQHTPTWPSAQTHADPPTSMGRFWGEKASLHTHGLTTALGEDTGRKRVRKKLSVEFFKGCEQIHQHLTANTVIKTPSTNFNLQKIHLNVHCFCQSLYKNKLQQI